jgi:Lysylphosphatidylglycerol synthase TM region
MSRAKVVQLLCFVAALGAMFWLLTKIGWASIGQALLRIGIGGAMLLAALGFMESILDGIAMAVAITQRRSGRVIFFNSLGAVLNQLLPFDLGEVAKAALIHRTFPRGATIAGTIVWNFIFKISRPLVTLLAAVTGLIGAASIDLSVRYLILGGALLSFIPYMVLRLVLRRGAAVMIVRLLRFLRITRRDPEKLLVVAREIDLTSSGFWQQRRSAFLGILFLQMGARLASWLSVFAALRLIGTSTTFTEGAALYAALNTAEFLITVIPARMGVAEGAAFGIFKLCGMSSSLGVIVYVVLRLKALITSGALAPFAFLGQGRSDGEVESTSRAK